MWPGGAPGTFSIGNNADHPIEGYPYTMAPLVFACMHKFDDWEPFNQRRDRALRSYEVTLGRIPFDLGALAPLD